MRPAGASSAGVTRRALQRAVAEGSVVRRGKVYALPEADEGATAARLLHGTATHRSAARHHGFALPPDEGEDVTCRRARAGPTCLTESGCDTVSCQR